jgi:hypothetical protein
MLCLTSKSYQLRKPRQANIREQLHCLGPKTDVNIVTLNSGRLNVDQNCSAFHDRRIEDKSNRERYLRSKYDTYVCPIQNPQFFDVPAVGETEHANTLDGWLG